MPNYVNVLNINRNLTTTQELLLGVNPSRQYCLIVNDSDTVCWISLGKPAAANTGIRLNAYGGSFEINAINPYFGDIYAVSGAATKKIMVTEY